MPFHGTFSQINFQPFETIIELYVGKFLIVNKLVLRPSEILLETRSARSKILAVKLARSLEALLGLNYRVWRSSSSMLETRSIILDCKTRSLAQ